VSEDKLQAQVSRASRASALLNDSLLQEAFATLDAEYMKAWRATAARDSDARERLWQAVQIVGKVRDHLVRVVETGKVAKAEVEHLAEQERRGLLRRII
jgi:hypothetical protein